MSGGTWTNKGGPGANGIVMQLKQLLIYTLILVYVEIKGWPVLGNIQFLRRKDIGKPVEDTYLMKASRNFEGAFRTNILGKSLRNWYVVHFSHVRFSLKYNSHKVTSISIFLSQLKSVSLQVKSIISQ